MRDGHESQTVDTSDDPIVHMHTHTRTLFFLSFFLSFSLSLVLAHPPTHKCEQLNSTSSFKCVLRFDTHVLFSALGLEVLKYIYISLRGQGKKVECKNRRWEKDRDEKRDLIGWRE